MITPKQFNDLPFGKKVYAFTPFYEDIVEIKKHKATKEISYPHFVWCKSGCYFSADYDTICMDKKDAILCGLNRYVGRIKDDTRKMEKLIEQLPFKL